MAHVDSVARIAAVFLVYTLSLRSGVFEEFQTSNCEPGVAGGQLVVGLRSEPRTLNPIAALDAGSNELISLVTADLIHINRGSLQAEPALAKDWTVSDGGKRYTLHLRKGLLFSDGHPFDADDVLFTFRVHLDEHIHSPQRETLNVGGRPVSVRKVDANTVVFDLAQPYAGGERLFDGIGILPRHLLERAYESGEIGNAWSLSTRPDQMAGLGPFRLKEYQPGQRIVLERNPNYWKVDTRKNRLPYLDEIVFEFVGGEDAQVLRFQAGETHVITGLSADNFTALKREELKHGLQLLDAGASLESSFLLLNQNDPNPGRDPSAMTTWKWFREARFRQALSLAIDRQSIVRLTYRGLAAPLWGFVTQGNAFWINPAIPRPERSPLQARELLRQAGFSWNSSGQLLDSGRQQVNFSILTSSGNAQRAQIATLIQDDLKTLGVNASIVSLEFRAMLDRIFRTHEYDAAVMTLTGGDTDPNAEMNLLVSHGNTRLWNLNGSASSAWEQEIDRLMRAQMITPEVGIRKKYYDQVQELVASNLPLIYLVSPHLLAGASGRLTNVRPSILSPYILWNAEQLWFKSKVFSGRTN